MIGEPVPNPVPDPRSTQRCPETDPASRRLRAAPPKCYDAFVRTTIELTPEAWHLAKAVARERDQSLGKVVSDFILRANTPAPHPERSPETSPAGFPLIRVGRAITSDDVSRLIDEDTE